MKKIFTLILLLAAFLPAQTDTLLYEDFEDGLEGWTAKNLVDSTQSTLWRITNTRSVSPVHSAAWNDSLTNSYPDGLYEALDSPPITIPYNARTFMKFKAFIHLTLNGTYYHDYFFIKYTTNNGNTWNNFLPYAVSGQQLVWRSFPEDFGPTANDELTYWAGKTMRFRILTRSDTIPPNGIGVFLDDFFIYSEECTTPDPNEPNNNTTTATEVTLGDIVPASLCPQNDEDVYKFYAEQGEQVNITTQHSMAYTYLYLLNPNGFTILYAYNELTYTIPSTGNYYVRVTGSYNYSADYTIYFNNRPSPDVISVEDIPDDQGLQVRVKWLASFYDPQTGNGDIKEYQLWRKINDSLSAISKSTVLRKMDSKDSPAESWEFIASIPALSNRPFLNYSYVAPTIRDSLQTVFIVAAIPEDPQDSVEWGLEGSGFSIDNLLPGLESYTVSHMSGGIILQWLPDAQDIDTYEIYKGIYEIFPPLPETKIAELPFNVTQFVDSEIINGFDYFYILSVKDLNGNVYYSPSITPGAITSLSADNILPDKFLLKQNYPNPFNSSSRIEFIIAEEVHVNLTVYNIIGEPVQVLKNESLKPGSYDVSFDGSALASGFYIYRLRAGAYIESRKMILLK